MSMLMILTSSKGLSKRSVLTFSIICTTSAPLVTCAQHAQHPLSACPLRQLHAAGQVAQHKGLQQPLTRPHTVCLLSSQGVGTQVMKNLRASKWHQHCMQSGQQACSMRRHWFSCHAAEGLPTQKRQAGAVRTESRWCWAQHWPWRR